MDKLKTQPTGSRRLIYIPVLHSPEIVRWSQLGIAEDMAMKVEQLGFGSIWKDIQYHLGKLNAEKIRVYQDSWTRGTLLLNEEVREGLENVALEISREEGTGVPSEISVLFDLSAKNSVILERTEDEQLIQDTSDAFREIDKIASEPGLEEMSEEQFGQLVRRVSGAREEILRLREPRDIFIARRIDETLQAGEVGILFMGVLHDVASKLPPDIQGEPLTENLREVTSEIKERQIRELKKFPGWPQQNLGGGPERM